MRLRPISLINKGGSGRSHSLRLSLNAWWGLNYQYPGFLTLAYSPLYNRIPLAYYDLTLHYGRYGGILRVLFLYVSQMVCHLQQ